MPDTIPSMGRPAKGESARTIAASTKISRVEKRTLEQSYGTVHRALRAGVDLLLSGEAVTGGVGAARETTKCRIHPDWTTSETWFDQGVELVKKTCVVCGHEVVDRAR